jgi:hypothetical protein
MLWRKEAAGAAVVDGDAERFVCVLHATSERGGWRACRSAPQSRKENNRSETNQVGVRAKWLERQQKTEPFRGDHSEK